MVVKEREHCLCWWKDERLKSLIKEQLNHIGIKAKEAQAIFQVNRIIILLIVQLEVGCTN